MVTISELNSRGKLIETLFSTESIYDKKRKTNLNPMVSFDDNIINEIEQGNITTELLESMNIDILKYKTQITLHADFSDVLSEKYHGYKSLIVNKNNSLGVKYVAVDESKRTVIAQRLLSIGIRYNRNSTKAEFYKMIALKNDESNVENFNNLCEIFNIAKENNHLYIGDAHLSKISIYGTIYIIFTMNIKSIRSENCLPLCEAFGVTEESFKEYTNEIIKRKVTANIKHNKARELRKKSIKNLMDSVTQPMVNVTLTEPIKFIKPMVETIWGRGDNDDKYRLVYNLAVIGKLPRKRKFTMFEITFETYEECVNYYNKNEIVIYNNINDLSYKTRDFNKDVEFENVILF